jgi:hypothetical protein
VEAGCFPQFFAALEKNPPDSALHFRPIVIERPARNDAAKVHFHLRVACGRFDRLSGKDFGSKQSILAPKLRACNPSDILGGKTMHIARRQLLSTVTGMLTSVQVGAHVVASSPNERLGLLLVAHGSRRAQWNEKALSLAEKVRGRIRELGVFDSVELGFMEFAEPTIADSLTRLEQAGCTRIVAVPIFVMVGHHSLFDVPAALGIYYSRHAMEHLEQEGIPIAKPRVPILYTSTLDDGDLLERFTLQEIQQLSSEPKDEGVVILFHGDAELRPMIEKRLRDLVIWCSSRSGISYFDYAHVGIGQGLEHHGLPVILNALKHLARVLVVGLYLGLSAQSILNYARSKSEKLFNELAGSRVLFSTSALIDFPPLVDFVIEHASRAANLATHCCSKK